MSKLYLNHKIVFIASVVLILSVVLVTFLAIYFVAINSEKTPIAIDENGNELFSGKVYDMPSNLIFTSDVEEVSDNDGVNLRAIIKPDTAHDKTLKMTIAWKNPDSAFATGKDVERYIMINTVNNDDRLYNVRCMEPFGEKIILTAVSRSNPRAKATCELDYMTRPSEAIFGMNVNTNSDSETRNWAFSLISYTDYQNDPIRNVDMISSSILLDNNFWSSVNVDFDLSMGTITQIYTLRDEIASYNIKFEATDLLLNYYKKVMIGNPLPPPCVYDSNTTTDKYLFVDKFFNIIAFPANTYYDIEEYNALLNFYRSNVGSVFFTSTVTFTTESGFVYTDTQQYTFTEKSLGMIVESIELDRGTVRL